MSLTDLISPESIIPALRAQTRRQVMQEMSEKASALSGVPATVVFEAVRLRERLGGTGVGGGVAIPHAKSAGVKRIFGVFARLERGVEFDARDGAPVDLFFMLIAPELAGAEHLKALSRVARALHDPAFVARLRGAVDAAALHVLFSQDVHSRAA